jgi:uncharacterized protein DUF7014/AbiJ-like protein
MGVFETFTKRGTRLQNAGKQDLYQYDVSPREFRVQVIHIWNGAIGNYDRSYHNSAWTTLHSTLIRELGVFRLSQDPSDIAGDCKSFLLQADTPGALDIIDLSFRVIDLGVREFDAYETSDLGIRQLADDAIEELNYRFREHGLGYQFVEHMLVRVDSQFVHSEVVKPALSLLNASGFDGPADEFVRAFDHYRHGRNKEAVAEALKSFESTMKTICAARKWAHAPNATAKPLLDALFSHGLIPAELVSHFSGLRSAMESGLPTLSNRTSRHGQGAVPTQIPPYFAAHAMHLLASNIIFLVEAHKALP